MKVKELTNSTTTDRRIRLSLAFILSLLFTQVQAQNSGDLQDIDAIEATAEKYALEEIRNSTLEISQLSASANKIDPRLRLARCDQALEAFSMTQGTGAARMTVGVRCPGSTPWTLYVPVQLDATVQVVTASRPLSRGETPTSGDLSIEEFPLSRLPGSYITSTDALTNKELIRNIRQGDVLTSNMFRDRKLIKKGQKVIIFAQSPGIEVKMAGIAQENGILGEMIAVQNTNSGKTVQATVKDGATVVVGL